MPFFRAEIHKLAEGEKFANDYLIEATTIAAAAALAQTFADLERSLMSPVVAFLDIRTSTEVAHDRVFTHTTLNNHGTGPASEAGVLPGFCTLRVDFPTTNGDPGHKYYRYVIDASFQQHGVINPASVVALQTIVNNTLTSGDAALSALRIGKNHLAPVSVVVYPFVQERQEHRHKKKKAVVAGGTGV
jgi:hypothetical protein